MSEIQNVFDFEKSKTPKSPEGDFKEFIDFQRIPL